MISVFNKISKSWKFVLDNFKAIFVRSLSTVHRRGRLRHRRVASGCCLSAVAVLASAGASSA